MSIRLGRRTKVWTAGLATAFLAIGCGDDDGSSPPTSVDGGVEAGADTRTDTETSDGTETTDNGSSQTTDDTDSATTDDDTNADSGVTTDDDDGGVADGGSEADSGDDSTPPGDGGADSSVSDAGADAGPPVGWVELEVGQATAIVAPVEADGDDSYLGVVFDRDGNFYAVGSATDTSGEAPDVYMAVTKFLANGDKDAAFGDDGVARINVAVGGLESVRAIAVQTTGEPATDYLVIAGTAQFEPAAVGLAANEEDVAIVRFTMAGAVDAAFGDAGVVRIDLNSGVEGLDRNDEPAWVSNDSVWSLGTTADGKLVVHGSQRASEVITLDDGGVTPREDSDWVLLRLNADGTLDNDFGDEGKVTLDLAGAGASARSATVLADGSIIGSGYLTSDVLGESTQQPVLYKVTEDGVLDATFATADAWAAPGVFHDMVVAPPLRAEAYGAALQGNNLVTMGYGPTSGDGVGSDFIALRFTADGAFDTSFGTNGVTYIDGVGQSDNGRSLVILPDQTVLGIGGGRTLLEDETTPSDGMLALLTPDGLPIDDFGEHGRRLYDLGGTNDFFWAGAVSPDESQVVVVGLKGASGEGEDADTDGAFLLLPLSEPE